VRVPALPAGNVEDSRAVRKAKHVYDSRCFVPVALESEDRLVLEEVLGIEVRLPPLSWLRLASPGRWNRFSRGQKNTGSRYAPNTSSMAARISYSVQ
jgi:hypothetical protein